MKTNNNRRAFLQTTALAGTALLLPIQTLQALPLQAAKTPAITADEMVAIDAASGKKGAIKRPKPYTPYHFPQRPEDEDQRRTCTYTICFGGWV